MGKWILGTLLVAAAAAAAGGGDPPTRGTSAPRSSVSASQKVFATHCAKCHGATGMADTPDARALKVAPLADHPRLKRMTPPDIAAAVKANAKHRGIVQLEDRDIDAAAAFVKRLAGHE